MRNIRLNLFLAFDYNAAGVLIAAGVLYPVAGVFYRRSLQPPRWRCRPSVSWERVASASDGPVTGAVPEWHHGRSLASVAASGCSLDAWIGNIPDRSTCKPKSGKSG